MNFLGENYGYVREWLKRFTRDGEWWPTRQLFVEKFNHCECCGTRDDLNVHHIFPVHVYPQLELEPYNLITLCRKHHFQIGHLNDWKKWNPYVWEMAQLYNKGIMAYDIQFEGLELGQQPDYEKILRQLKVSKGNIIQLGGGYDSWTKTKNIR